MIKLAFAIDDSQWGEEQVWRILCEEALAHAIPRLHLEALNSELSVLLTNDSEIRKLNKMWRGKDTSTNVLSFPTFMPARDKKIKPLLGDIALAYETCAKEAQIAQKKLSHHFTHLFLHGFLHLLGYDHIEAAQAEDMEQMEVEILQHLSIKNPYNHEGRTYE